MPAVINKYVQIHSLQSALDAHCTNLCGTKPAGRKGPQLPQ